MLSAEKRAILVVAEQRPLAVQLILDIAIKMNDHEAVDYILSHMLDSLVIAARDRYIACQQAYLKRLQAA